MEHKVQHIIKQCLRGNRLAQKELYNTYSPKLMGVARRYMKNTHDAEDVLANAFFKIFSYLKDFTGQGSLEGWMKRIVVNEALMVLRKKTSFHLSIEDDYVEPATQPSILYDLQYADIIKLVDELPTGYRTIFNMYAIEGYKHREIGEILGISINTAKSQYLHAKKRLAAMIKKKMIINKPQSS